MVPIAAGAGVGQSDGGIVITDVNGSEAQSATAVGGSGAVQLDVESTTLQPVVLSTS